MLLFKNKYRIKSARKQGWDYSTPGYYFITVCTKNRIKYFGEIRNGNVELTESGKIVQEEWIRVLKIRPNIRLDEFIIMPNHLHGIIEICEYRIPRFDIGVVHHSGMMIQNISNIIRGFKSAVTKRIHISVQNDFQWQERFYDRIIRDENELNNVRNYIRNNPRKWKNTIDNKGILNDENISS